MRIVEVLPGVGLVILLERFGFVVKEVGMELVVVVEVGERNRRRILLVEIVVESVVEVVVEDESKKIAVVEVEIEENVVEEDEEMIVVEV
mmetsp:Transcript_31221/g.48715  ORF Transcript_31221/g.48715 Transcript_31221/m.48715 type:complete len:90 (+) Transcript_31221:419-688(+)